MNFFLQRPQSGPAEVVHGSEIEKHTMEVEDESSGEITPPPSEVPERPSAPSPKLHGSDRSGEPTLTDDQGNVFVAGHVNQYSASPEDEADLRNRDLGGMSKSQSMISIPSAASPDLNLGRNRNLSASNLKRESSFCANGKRERSGKVPRRNISFGSKELFHIPTRNSFSNAEKQSMWYDHIDVNSFIGDELQRRRVLGVTSTNALCPEPVAGIPEEHGVEDGMLTF